MARCSPTRTSWVQQGLARGDVSRKRGNCTCACVGQRTNLGWFASYEWAIEMKYVRFIGDNGKNNDYGVTKVASPCARTATRLDAERLQGFTPAKRRAIVMYGFEFDSASSITPSSGAGRTHWRSIAGQPGAHETHGRSVAKEDPDTHRMSMQDLIAIFEAAAGTRGVRLSPCVQFAFTGLERHPLYRIGRVLHGKFGRSGDKVCHVQTLTQDLLPDCEETSISSRY